MQNLSNFCFSRAYLLQLTLTIRTAGFSCHRMEFFPYHPGFSSYAEGRSMMYNEGLLRLLYISIGFDLAVFNSIGKQVALLRVVWFLNLSNYDTIISNRNFWIR